MKRIKELILVLICIVFLSGCVKEHITMNINKDKSLELKYDVLLSDKLNELGEEGEDTDISDDVAELEKKGYTVTAKSENGYSGYTISKKYKSIDDLANNNNNDEVSLGGFIEEEEGQDLSKTFKVKKGFLKNVYTAKFSFEFNAGDEAETEEETDLDTNDESMVPTTEQALTTEENQITALPEEGQSSTEATEEDATASEEDFSQLAGLMAEMEFTYEVNLPYGAISSNATKTSNNNKTLTWNLATEGKSAIEYTFAIYNLTNIIIIGGAALLVIIIIIVIVVVSKKKKGSKETLIHTDYDSSIVDQINNSPMNNEIPQGPVNHEFSVPEQPNQNNGVNVTQGPVDNTPTIMNSTEIKEPNKFITPQQMVNPMENVTQGPAVNQGVAVDVPNMAPVNDNDQNIINQ